MTPILASKAVKMTEIELLQWILGGVGTLSALLFGIWWKIEARQDRKIDTLRADNEQAHIRLHTKIDDTQDELTRQHLTLRDKIEDIWKHVVRDKRP